MDFAIFTMVPTSMGVVGSLKAFFKHPQENEVLKP
jgi:hypothetical protein